jgi:predicted tellurium resistance membrane protein TerC
MDVILNLRFDLTTFMMVVFIDLVLSGDNAIIIGMAAAKLPPVLRCKAIVWGIGLAVLFRIVLAGATVYLLNIIGLKLIGGVLLFAVCYQLWKDLASDGDAETAMGEESDAVDGDHRRRRYFHVARQRAGRRRRGTR